MPPGKEVLLTKNTNYQSIDAYTNADWTADVGDRWLALEYFTCARGNPITWKSKKQNVISCSSAKASSNVWQMHFARRYG